MESDVTYEDATVRIDADGVTLPRYYFPTGRSKVIALASIESATVESMGWMTKWRLWGSTNLTNWFPLDMARPRKREAVVLHVGGRLRPSFTPDDPARVVELLS